MVRGKAELEVWGLVYGRDPNLWRPKIRRLSVFFTSPPEFQRPPPPKKKLTQPPMGMT